VKLLAGVLAAAACIAAAAAQSTGLVMPVSPACVSSPFGPRVLPGKPLAGTYHYGIDLPAPAGGAVYAVAAGEVVTLHRRGLAGLEVVLRHPGGFNTLYAHLGSVTPALAEGKRQVVAGEKIGVVGRTGLSYGTHVYFELQVNGQRVDPAPYLRVSRCK
jgi:murein DD-endopeptidase MepM/ murein hydrolase activator NlpD